MMTALDICRNYAALLNAATAWLHDHQAETARLLGPRAIQEERLKDNVTRLEAHVGLPANELPDGHL